MDHTKQNLIMDLIDKFLSLALTLSIHNKQMDLNYLVIINNNSTMGRTGGVKQ
jgi:hypothetical protein